MARNLHMPAAGEALSAAWARELVAEVRSQRLHVTPPLAIDVGPEGTTLRCRPTPPAAGAPVRPWELTLAGASASCAECCYMRGPVFKWLGTITGTVSGADGTAWLGARIDTDTGSAELVSGGALASVSASDLPADRYVMLPLYKLVAAGDSWRVAVDFRSIGLMLYV